MCDEVRLVLCEVCGSEGRILRSNGAQVNRGDTEAVVGEGDDAMTNSELKWWAIEVSIAVVALLLIIELLPLLAP